MSINVLLACGDAENASTLRASLAQLTGGVITCNVTSVDDGIERTIQWRPDVLLLECGPHEESAVAVVLAHIALASPSTRVLMLWDCYTAASLLAFVQHGACGCLLKSSSAALFAKAIACVHEGGTWFGRGDLVEAMRSYLKPAAQITLKPGDDTLLTPREREILGLIGTGLSNKEIGRRLSISDQTVKTHLHHIYVKLERSGRYKAFLARPAPVHVSNGPS